MNKLGSALIALAFSAPAFAGDIFTCTQGNNGATPTNPSAGFYFDLPSVKPRPNPMVVRFRGNVRAMPDAVSLVGQIRIATGASFDQNGLIDMSLGVTKPNGTTQTLAWVSAFWPAPYTFLGHRDGNYLFDAGNTTYFCTETFKSGITPNLHNRLETF